MKIQNMAGYAKISTGQYTGDDSVNRAIAHSLGRTPKIVFILRNTGAMWYSITSLSAAICYLSATLNAYLAVTAMNATSFYVGNASGYAYSANQVAAAYLWIAIG